MIKSWIFEFLYAPQDPELAIDANAISNAFETGFRNWARAEKLGYEGIFFSEHHFSLSYSPSPNLLIASLAQRSSRLRLGTMGMVLPFYQPWRIVEEISMLDHLTGGRLEVGLAAGVVRSVPEVAAEPHVVERGSIVEVDDRAGGTFAIPQAPWRFSGATAGVAGPPAWRGEHNRRVLTGLLGRSDDEVDALEAAGVLVARPPRP